MLLPVLLPDETVTRLPSPLRIAQPGIVATLYSGDVAGLRSTAAGAWWWCLASKKPPLSHRSKRGATGGICNARLGGGHHKTRPKNRPLPTPLDASRPALPLVCRLPRVCCPQLRSLISTEDAALPDGATEVVVAIQKEQGHVVSCPVELTITRGDCWAGEVRHSDAGGGFQCRWMGCNWNWVEGSGWKSGRCSWM
jgi:hypothetical protein